jgi:DNA repair protein RecO (recombination protein O)
VQVLRSFERVLLRETGYAMALNRTVARRAVERAPLRVRSRARRAQREATTTVALAVVTGQTLLDMEQDDYHQADGRAEQDADALPAEHLYLGGTPLAAPDPDRPAKPPGFF